MNSALFFRTLSRRAVFVTPRLTAKSSIPKLHLSRSASFDKFPGNTGGTYAARKHQPNPEEPSGKQVFHRR
jgi:hypothetical protein